MEDIRRWETVWGVSDSAYVEYILSCSYICDALMKDNCMILHGASVLWQDRAYIFSAASGTGKTTQLLNWKNLLGEEVAILNGDKPVIEMKESGSVMVHPSPWKGKEGYGRDDISVPLGGIIVLAQKKENSIERMDQGEAVNRLFGRIYSTFSTEEEVFNAARLLECLLGSVPVWLLNNKGDLESALITHQAIHNWRDSH